MEDYKNRCLALEEIAGKIISCKGQANELESLCFPKLKKLGSDLLDLIKLVEDLEQNGFSKEGN